MQTVVCLRWGTSFGVEYVNRLHRAVRRHVSRPTRFVVFSEHTSGLDVGIDVFPIPPVHLPPGLKPGPWRKLALWSPHLADIEGDALFLDLDVLVTGHLDPLFDYAPGQLCLIRNWTQGRREGIGNSSVLRFRVGSATHLLRDFESDAVAMSHRFDNEQIYVTRAAGLPIAYWPADWCPSFKHTLLPPWPVYLYRPPPPPPPEAKIVVFTGRPRPDEAAQGRWPAQWYKKFYKSLPPTSWISNHWY